MVDQATRPRLGRHHSSPWCTSFGAKPRRASLGRRSPMMSM